VAERRVEFVMGMPVSIEVRGPLPPRRLDEVFDWIRLVDAVFSTYRADSEIARLARGTLAAADAHRCVREVLSRCEQLHGATGGFFDIRATGRLDPSGFVKGGRSTAPPSFSGTAGHAASVSTRAATSSSTARTRGASGFGTRASVTAWQVSSHSPTAP
jgi:thiamine biosynthesis lipoprotein